LGTKFKAVATTAQAKKTMASQKVTQLPAKAAISPRRRPPPDCDQVLLDLVGAQLLQ